MDVIDRLTPPLEVGRRAVIRHRLALRQAQGATPQDQPASATDTLGVVASLDADRIIIIDRDQQRITISRAAIVAARRLPLVSRGRDPLRLSPGELQRLATSGWVADQEPLGDWVLRSAAGFTARANSCLASGDPGCSWDEALDRVSTHAAENGIQPVVQTTDESAEQATLRQRGWVDTHRAAVMMTIRLVDLIGADPMVAPSVEVTETMSDEWLQAYLLTRPTDVDHEVVRQVLTGRGPQAYALIRRPDAAAEPGQPIAIGKAHVQADWTGLAALWTAPDQRRQGLMSKVVSGLGAWAAGRGARSAYLQVEQSNEVARSSYGQRGWTQHHTYSYLRRPDPSHR